MLNESITELSKGITYESWTNVTTSLPFIINVILIYTILLGLYILSGVLVKSPSGKRMIQYSNYYYGFFILLLLNAVFLFFLINPLWMKLL